MTKANSVKRSSVSTMLKAQKKTWNSKKNLAEKRLSSLSQTPADFDKAIVPISRIQYVKTTNGSGVVIANSVEERAKEIQRNLATEFPSCLKTMLPSNVSGGYWLSLPRDFCTRNLPSCDATILLVDENENENEKRYGTNYLVKKNGLSGGWRRFSKDKGLVAGDVLIYQLVEPCKLKVYIVRSERLTDLDGVVNHLSFDKHVIAMPIDTVEPREKEWPSETENIMYGDKPLSSWNIANTLKLIADYDPNADKSDIDFDDDNDMYSGPGMLEGIRFSQSVVKFKDVKSFEDFTIDVNGLNLDSEFQTPIRKKYYELCSSRGMFLHENIVEGLNCKLVTGMISEIINISDGIRGVTSSASVTYLERWDITLTGFECLGMAVGFLRDRIRKLVNPYRESQAVLDLKRIESDELEHQMRCIEENLRSVRAKANQLGLEIQDLTEKTDGIDLEFMEVAGAPWGKL